MAVQNENLIFPHVVPPSPTETGNVRDDISTLYRWVADTTQALTDLNRQIVDKHNGHVTGTHAHPKAWANWRLPRPRYYCDTSGTTVTVPASATVPVRLVINGKLYEVYSNLTCDLSGTGAGGLDEGSVAANTPYYLYGIDNAGAAALMASDNPPSSGPTGYDAWTYIGACATYHSAATIYEFQAINGICIFVTFTELDSTTSASLTSKTFSTMPVTARHAYFELKLDAAAGNGANDYVSISSDGTNNLLIARGAVNAIDAYMYGWVPIITAQTIYIRSSDTSNTCYAYLFGWQECPEEYP